MLTLRYTGSTKIPVEAECLTPDNVAGKSGNEIGSGMRRGLIAIGGDTGDFPGVSLIAGSLFLFGKPGVRVGAGMKRGSIVVASGLVPLLPSFRFDCTYKPVFLAIYLR